MAFHALTDNDKIALTEAVQLIKDVAGRHPLELTGPILVAVQACVHDIEILRKYLEAGAA